MPPYGALAYQRFAGSYAQAGNHVAAATEYRSGHRINPMNAWASVQLAQELDKSGQPSASLEALRMGAENTFDRRVHMRYATALNALGRHGETRNVLERLVRINPENALVHAELGGFLAGVSELEAAAASLERALEIDPNLEAARKRLEAIRRQPGERAAR